MQMHKLVSHGTNGPFFWVPRPHLQCIRSIRCSQTSAIGYMLHSACFCAWANEIRFSCRESSWWDCLQLLWRAHRSELEHTSTPICTHWNNFQWRWKRRYAASSTHALTFTDPPKPTAFFLPSITRVPLLHSSSHFLSAQHSLVFNIVSSRCFSRAFLNRRLSKNYGVDSNKDFMDAPYKMEERLVF